MAQFLIRLRKHFAEDAKPDQWSDEKWAGRPLRGDVVDIRPNGFYQNWAYDEPGRAGRGTLLPSSKSPVSANAVTGTIGARRRLAPRATPTRTAGASPGGTNCRGSRPLAPSRPQTSHA